LTNRVNDFNVNIIFYFRIESICIRKHKQNQDKDKINNLKEKK